uniref:NADH-ubiquinone oxidoreductase chain 5 n=1 Tax=Hutchinsoniella macracantha TaxID=84335 RepID=Q6SKZ8_9CRUS|nr:NADH dehydrogenase subunit 5 [Hutchinsoniella macracantha]
MTCKMSMYLKFSTWLMISSLFTTLLSMYIVIYNHNLIIEWEITTTNTAPINFIILIDMMSSIFLSTVFFISAMVIMYSEMYMEHDKTKNRFLILVLFFVLSMSLLIISPNMISMLLGWDGLGFTSYVLVIYYQNPYSQNAGMITALSNRIGDAAILLAIAYSMNLGYWNLPTLTMNPETSPMIMLPLLIILASITKSAQIPFSAWLPMAMAAPTPVSALVHSSTLVTAGVYLSIRFSPIIQETISPKMMLLILGTLTMLMAGANANMEMDFKKIIALSTLSQLGLMMMILSTGQFKLTLFHLITHAMFKSLLFLCAGMMIHNSKNYQDIRAMSKTTMKCPTTSISFSIASLALCGFPFTAGFYSKDMIMEMTFMNFTNLTTLTLLLIATGMTASYSIRLMFYLTKSNPLSLTCSPNDKKNKMMTSPILLLTIMATTVGSLLTWFIFPNPEMICLPLPMKTATLFTIILGMLLGLILSNINQKSNMNLYKKFNKYKDLSNTMWFMKIISSTITINKPLHLGNNLNHIYEKGWAELYGPQGTYNILTKTSANMQTYQMNNLKTFLFMFFMWNTIIFISFL